MERETKAEINEQNDFFYLAISNNSINLLY